MTKYPLRARSRKSVMLIPLGCLALAMLACSSVGGLFATETPLPTSTPTPTDTPTPTNTRTNTPIPTNTPNYQATTAAEETAAAEVLFARIDAVLAKDGAARGTGRLVLNKPDENSVSIDGSNMMNYYFLETGDVGDFAWHSRFTWNSDKGLSGCGYIFRIEDADNFYTTRYYDINFSRLSGAPMIIMNLIDTWTVTRNITWKVAAAINDGQGEENEILLIARKNEFKVFVNGKRVAVLYDSSISKGRLAQYVSTNVGFSECVYKDTWIWEWLK